MKVNSYKYLVNPDIDVYGYMTAQYTSRVQEYLESIEIKGKCAVLYAGGALLTPGEARKSEDSGDLRRPLLNSTLAIKELAAFSMHKYIGMLKGKENIEYASINGNTCASSMYSLYEAEQLMLNQGYEEVIIITEEKTSYNTLRVFDESRIDLEVGEGVAIIHLSKEGNDISDCKWSYEYARNPFLVSESGYSKIDSISDYVNPHGTGTEVNESAESSLVQGRKQIRYKESTGHTQGASGLIEVCMVLDEEISGDVLCVSSGLGGFYGSCIVHK